MSSVSSFDNGHHMPADGHPFLPSQGLRSRSFHHHSHRGRQQMSHRAEYYGVHLPEIYLVCNSYQYIVIYNIVTELLVYSVPEKAAYLDQLNSKLMTTDVSRIEGIVHIIREAQEKLREHIDVINQWVSVHFTEATRHYWQLHSDKRGSRQDGTRPVFGRETDELLSAQQHKSISLLKLDRRKSSLELYLRTAVDMLTTAQKQWKQSWRGGHPPGPLGSGVRRSSAASDN
ncbi:hypothetical protein EV182_008014, partial [Spiromyces aspiralis]